MKNIIQQLKRRIFLLFILLGCSLAIFSQSRGVEGTVTDVNGEVLIGVNVLVKGSSTGVITDISGRYALPSVVEGATLVFSSIGYKSAEVKVSTGRTIDVQLSEDTQLVDEIIVVGYGTQKKSSISGSVASVKANDLPKTATASVGNMLRGKAAGLQITQNSATPGGSLNIHIRGNLTESSPLIVIDGVPQVSFNSPTSGTVYNGAQKDNQLMGLNPNDIESIDILKDASAAAIYGSDAAGGVILITTKRGKEGSVDVSYNGSVAFQYLSDLPKFLSTRDFMIEQNKVFDELGRSNDKKHSQEKIDSFVGNGTNWMDEVTRLGVINEHNVSLTSGTAKTKVLSSLSYFDHQGIAKNNGMNRITGRLNVDQELSRIFKVGVSTTYAQIKYNDVPLGDTREENSALILSAMTFNPTVPVFDENGEYSNNPDRNIYPNPVSLLDIYDETKNSNFFTSGYLEAKLLPELNIRLTAGIDKKDVLANQYIPTTTKVGKAHGGQASKQTSQDMMLMTSAIANYTKQFADVQDISIMAGVEYKKQSWEGMSIIASQFPYDGALNHNIGTSEQEKPTISSKKGSREMASFVARLNYAYNNRYVATFNMRVDGSSNFAPKHQYGIFPGGSVAWRVSEESFMVDNLPWFNNLKLRAGIGRTGNAGNLTGIYTYYSTLENAYAFDGSMVNGVEKRKIGNENLKWETLTDVNFGIDFGFIKNRISGTIDLYQRTRSDVILQKSLMSYHQIRTIDYNSAVKYQARGIDFDITTTNFDTKDFRWTTEINFSYYVNRTISRDPDFIPEIYQAYREKWGNRYSYVSDGIIGASENVPYMAGAQPGSIKLFDLNGYKTDAEGNKLRDNEGRYIYSGTPDGVIDAADMIIIGNTTPIPFSINNTFRYKNWDLNLYLYGSLHGYRRNDVLQQSSTDIASLTNGLNALQNVKDRWSPTNPDGTLPGVYNSLSGFSEGDFFYENAWYLRLDNITLGYSIPLKRANKWVKSIRAYASTRNLYVFTPFGGMDPETGNGIGAYPNQRSFALGLDVKF
ncbi:TonB-dependent receptor SusC [termite gut metagenome]|uniref:TonB-dependent receptor SusC n=1 Tax=termite gut metagenome TaxID=433724 RepID=A0A5J4SKH4_9ZZZZ